MDLINFLFDTSQWPPRWHCGHWTDALGWVHIISDLAIFGAYYAIPMILIYFCYIRRDLPFYKIFVLFALFIVFCGTGHLVEAIIFWHPIYRFDALVKACTAIVSWATVFALIPLIPKILLLPKLEENLAESNAKLLKEIEFRKETEKDLAISIEELKYTNKEMEIFTHITSHDLRAPLISLKGFTEELKILLKQVEPTIEKGIGQLAIENQDSVRKAVGEDIPEALKFITSSIDKMDHLSTALLELSRLGKKTLTFKKINTNKLVQASIEALQHQIKEKKIIIDLDVLPDVVADDSSLQQIFGNLLDNAIKYLDPNRQGKIKISGRHENGKTIFSIKDNGRGIAEENKHKLFSLFRRIDVPGVSGEGLGLSFIQTLIRRHRGVITFNSIFGEGSEFTFTLLDGLDKTKDANE